ncbi:MAG TPA: GNAT family N-acetyltransferase, partial [Pseudomonas pachastrellae]|nr:GNAT family N-acetyltransferase [Halopseudomonas pachastrellae]
MVPKHLTSINDIAAASWDGLLAADYPFLSHGFIRALEDSGAVCAASGWQPAHRVVERDGQLQALLPLYLKDHSWGEYVFDWQWA